MKPNVRQSVIIAGLAAVLACFSPPSQAGVLLGPVTNSANGHLYYLLQTNTWDNSEADAVSLGGHLATIRDQAEQDWVFSTFHSVGGVERSLWIGLREVGAEGNYQWVSGEPVNYTDWALGEPNNNLGACGGESYAQMVKVGGTWNDISSPTTCYTNNDPVAGVVELLDPRSPISNGSFESGAVGWTFTGGLSILGPAADPSVGVNGSHCASLGGGDIPNSTLSQTFPVLPNTNYLLSLATAAYASGAGRVGVVRVEIIAPDSSILASQSYTNVSASSSVGTDGFVRRLLAFKTPLGIQAATLRITDISPGGGVAVDSRIDDVQVSVQAPASAKNLLVNGSFEQPQLLAGVAYVPSGGMPGWGTTDSDFEVWTSGPETPSAEGWQNLEILSHAASATIWQTVATTPGEVYALSFSHTPRPGVGSTLTVLIDSQPIAAFPENGSALTSFNWQAFRTNFTAATALTTISFTDAAAGAAGTHLDNVALEWLPMQLTIRVSQVEICWETVTGRKYQVQYRSDLTGGAWLDWGSPIDGTGARLCVTDAVAPGEPQKLYRVVIVP